MKFQGKLTHWNDDKGFGFVEPNGGGDRAFVHIKEFKPRSRRPVNGEVIVYELTRDKTKRLNATNIRYSRGSSNAKKTNNAKTRTKRGSVLTTLFLIGLNASVFIGQLPMIVAGLYLVMSVIAFVAYGLDKSAAKKGSWRTQENTLHLFSLLGGWPGAYLAQRQFRHKSSKESFRQLFRITVVLNLMALIWLHTENGLNFLNRIVVLKL